MTHSIVIIFRSLSRMGQRYILQNSDGATTPRSINFIMRVSVVYYFSEETELFKLTNTGMSSKTFYVKTYVRPLKKENKKCLLVLHSRLLRGHSQRTSAVEGEGVYGLCGRWWTWGGGGPLPLRTSYFKPSFKPKIIFSKKSFHILKTIIPFP